MLTKANATGSVKRCPAMASAGAIVICRFTTRLSNDGCSDWTENTFGMFVFQVVVEWAVKSGATVIIGDGIGGGSMGGHKLRCRGQTLQRSDLSCVPKQDLNIG